MPLTKRYFYDVEIGFGTPEQKVILGVTMVLNQLLVSCNGKDGNLKPSKSSSLSKVYCVFIELFRIHKVLNVQTPVLVKITKKSVLIYLLHKVIKLFE